WPDRATSRRDLTARRVVGGRDPSPVRCCVGGGRPGRPRCRRSCRCGVVVRWWVVGRGGCPGGVVGPGRTVVVGRRGGGARGPGCSGRTGRGRSRWWWCRRGGSG